MDVQYNTEIIIEIEDLCKWINQEQSFPITEKDIEFVKTVREVGSEKFERIIITFQNKLDKSN